MMRRWLRLVLFFVVSTIPPVALAALGGNVDSITHDQSSSRAQLRAVVSNGYTIHSLLTEAGINVREYVSSQGIVFAIAWDGPNLPDLQQLLGNYFPQFSQAMSQRRASGIRGPVALNDNDLVVESSGHLRAFKGRAYVPSLLPPQVSIAEIQ